MKKVELQELVSELKKCNEDMKEEIALLQSELRFARATIEDLEDQVSGLGWAHRRERGGRGR